MRKCFLLFAIMLMLVSFYSCKLPEPTPIATPTTTLEPSQTPVVTAQGQITPTPIQTIEPVTTSEPTINPEMETARFYLNDFFEIENIYPWDIISIDDKFVTVAITWSGDLDLINRGPACQPPMQKVCVEVIKWYWKCDQYTCRWIKFCRYACR